MRGIANDIFDELNCFSIQMKVSRSRTSRFPYRLYCNGGGWTEYLNLKDLLKEVKRTAEAFQRRRNGTY